jgi:hypothetical protein
MTHTFSREAPLLLIDVGIGVVGFLLSLLWGKASRRKMSVGTVRMLAAVWSGIALFGMIMAFVM